MQLTVFSVEPQGGGAQNLADTAVAKDVLLADSTEIFAEVFVEPNTMGVDSAASPPRDLGTPAAPPNTIAEPIDLDAATPGMTAKVASERDVGELRDSKVSAPAQMQHKFVRQPTVTGTTWQDKVPLEGIAARPSQRHEDRPAVSVTKDLRGRPETSLLSDGAELVQVRQTSQKTNASRIVLAEQKQSPRQAPDDVPRSAGKLLKLHHEPQSLPDGDDRPSEKAALPVKPETPQGPKPWVGDSGPAQPASVETIKSGKPNFKSGKPNLHEPQVADLGEKSPPPSDPVGHAQVVKHHAFSLNDAWQNARPATKLSTTQPTPPGPDASDQKGQTLAPSAPSKIATEQSVYTVEIVSRSADTRAPVASGQPPRIHSSPAQIITTHPSGTPTDTTGAHFPANPATLDHSENASPLRVASTQPDATVGQQTTTRQPTTIDATAPPAAPTLTSETPSYTVLPNSVIGTRPQETGDVIEQALTASGSDGLLREERAPALDNARRSISGASRVELARSVAAQIGDAARGSTEGTIEVRLSPEELGRVRLSMIQTEFGLTVTIVAERAETLELIRRNTELFAQDLRNLGHQNIAFSFDQGAERQPFDDKTDSPDITTEESETDADSSRQHLSTSRVGADGRLDIRL